MTLSPELIAVSNFLVETLLPVRGILRDADERHESMEVLRQRVMEDVLVPLDDKEVRVVMGYLEACFDPRFYTGLTPEGRELTDQVTERLRKRD
jgi:hypothetical protein